jgi:hypothetical protein
LHLDNKESEKVSDRDTNNPSIPNQYARAKILQKGRKKFKMTTNHDQNYTFVD